MPGFVDVSGMTYDDIKRMNHADDYDEVVYQRTRKPNSVRASSVKFSVSDVWAAAVAAQIINGEYLKETRNIYNDKGELVSIKRRNRDIMLEFLNNSEKLTVDLVEAGENAREFLQSDLLLRTLKGKLTSFDSALKQVLDVQGQFDTVGNRYELAVVACLPASAERTKKREVSDSKVRFATGGLIGSIGDKINANVEVLSATYSKTYNIYWIRAITDQDQPVFFSNKESFDTGSHLTIKGTVKAHKDNLTQLNRVKVM